jgi:hypothetical protein
MPQFGGKDSKRHFTVVMGNKEHGLYVSSTPSSAARKAVTKLCTANKSKKVKFEIREITQGSKKKTYGPYEGYIEKLKEPIELKGRVIRYKPVAKLSGKTGAKKGGNGSDANNQPSSFNNLNKLNSAIPFSGEYISPPANELTFRQKRIKTRLEKDNELLKKKAAENALYLKKMKADLEQKEKEPQKERQRLLKELATTLLKTGKIQKFEYINSGPENIEFPPFYLLVNSNYSNIYSKHSLISYFLTFINNNYVAFHIKNLETIKDKGDIFAGPTHNFEEFTQDVNRYFIEPNNRICSKKIYLQKVDEKIYPTNRIENISGYHINPNP